MKKFKVTYVSRYNPMDTRRRIIQAMSKKAIRDNWHELMDTDEFRIKSIEQLAD